MSSKLSKPTIAFHWLTGLLFIGVLGLGLYMEDLAGPDKFKIMGIHKSLGFLVLLIAVARVIWRLKEGPIESISKLPRWQEIASKSIHHLLMLFTLLMPLSGVLMNIGGGRATQFFGVTIIPAIEKIEWLNSVGHVVHGGSVSIIIIILLLHIAGALKHQLIEKDGTLTRMLGR